MSYMFKPVNSSATIGILIKNAGIGIPGLSPTAEIRRINDSKYLDFSAIAPPYWVSSGGQKLKTLPAVPWNEGLYEWNFDQSIFDHDSENDYEVIYRNEAPYTLVAIEILSFNNMSLKSTDIEAITKSVWDEPVTPLGAQARYAMNLLWVYTKGHMTLGEANKINVFNDDGTFMFTLQLLPTERTTSNLMAGNLPTYGSAGRYQPNTNPDPELCMVYGVLRYPTGVPVADNDIEVYVDEKDLPQFAQHYLLTGKIVVGKTDVNGYFQMDLIRNARVTLHVKQSKLQCQFMVPNQDEISIENIPGVYGVLKEPENQF